MGLPAFFVYRGGFMPKRIDETGNRYGFWTVLEYDKNFTKTGGAA